MRGAHLLSATLLLLALTIGSAAARDARTRVATIGSGEAWATPAYVRDSGREGPSVVIVAGLHGNEPASTYAADQIRHWPIQRGRLAIIPRANLDALEAFKRRTPGVEKSFGDLNRNFPRVGRSEKPRGKRARALWEFVRSRRPDWVVDLHEGYDFYRTNPKSVGSTVIAGESDEAQIAATFLLDAVNATIDNSSRRFVRIGPPVDGGIARAAAEHLGAKALLLETTWTQARSLRARQHRLMVHRLLLHLGMIAHDFPVDTLLPAEPSDDRTIVGLYDAGGTGGNGVPYIWRQLRRREDLRVMRVGPTEIRAGALAGFDVVIFPGGTGSGQAKALGTSGRKALKRFVEGGGGYVGVCAGAYLACASFSWGAKLLDARTLSPKWRRGQSMLEVELTERGREIFGSHEAPFEVLFHNGPVLGPADSEALPDFEPLALFRTEVADNGTPKGLQVGTPAIASGLCGEGRVIVFSPHPEQTKGLEWLLERGVRWAARR